MNINHREWAKSKAGTFAMAAFFATLMFASILKVNATEPVGWPVVFWASVAVAVVGGWLEYRRLLRGLRKRG